MISKIEALCPLVARIILGLYFLLPGALLKIVDFQGTTDYMASHNMFMIPLFLVLTIIIQAAGGASLIFGYKTQIAAFLLAGLTLVISLVMHNFWAFEEGLVRGHETQNFVKNMGIMAGLLAIAGLGAGPFSLDNKQKS
jgi:putative oxidoreductase